jgi:hypothetical protein
MQPGKQLAQVRAMPGQGRVENRDAVGQALVFPQGSGGRRDLGVELA